MPVAVFNAFDAEKQVEVQASLRYLTRLTPRARGPNMLILEYGPFVRKSENIFYFSLIH